MIARLINHAECGHLAKALNLLTQYVGASHYLLARCDRAQNGGVDFAICSDWPFDLVRRIGRVMADQHAKSNELEKCISVLQPAFAMLPDEAVLPRGVSRQYCAIPFAIGRVRLSLLMLFPQDVILSRETLREMALLTGYFASAAPEARVEPDRDCDLTERELECVFWIAEGKTSDEIAVILGISRNTINNYITSVMRKTATKTRSEAIAYSVRNNLV
ncbi:helix-turn-helix transcriptional regulator [Xaviernesmea oryzae]|uniref:Helix-turn-helix transcriptional regulator n=2 Tax=Xaviernesmea oryzae TaxID=464029 RepID=A0A1Q9ASL0_9HYPH|nr:LuxR family transcriptional regulator [Xaviernesmea oryzae]OLP58376.1 helix-turn-helix transcriptional regulator [Xaviernesmea oryzae]